MKLVDRITGMVAATGTVFDWLQAPFALFLRLYVGWQFFKAGMVKIQDWDTTLFLFQEEYHVPLLPPHAAAVAGTAGELGFPVLLALGLGTRLAAVGMSAVNIMAVVAYAHVLFSAGFEGALGQHLLWGTMLLVTVIYGPGTLSMDQALLRRQATRPR